MLVSHINLPQIQCEVTEFIAYIQYQDTKAYTYTIR